MSTSAVASLSKFSLQTGGAGTNQALLMPKLKYRFRVIFTGFGDPNDTLEMTRQVQDITRPSVTFDMKTIDVYNSRINYAGKPKWGNVTVTVRDDVTSAASLLIAKQIQKQFDFFEQSAATSAGDYKFDMAIEMTDGGNGQGEDAVVIERWICYGCIVESSNYDSLTYSDSTQVVIKLTVMMDNCVQQIGDGSADPSDSNEGLGSATTNTRVKSADSSHNMVYSATTGG